MSARLRVGQRDSRVQLPGTQTPTSGRSTPFYEHSFNETERNRSVEDLEGQNDELLEGLNVKVKLLKDVTLAIGREVKDSATQLSQMNDAYAETSGILSGTFNRLKRMSARQGCRYLWYIVFLAIVFWFFVVVWYLRR